MLCPKCHKIMARVRSTVLEDEYCCVSDQCTFSFVEYTYGQKKYNNCKGEPGEQAQYQKGAVEPSQNT